MTNNGNAAEIALKLNSFTTRVDDGDVIMSCPDAYCYADAMADLKDPNFVADLMLQVMSHVCRIAPERPVGEWR